MTPELEERDWEVADPLPVLLGRFAMILAVLTAFVLLVPKLGFMLSAVFLTGVSIWLAGERRRWVWSLVVAIGAPVLLWFFFATFLGTRFPYGSWLRALGL